MKQQSKSFTRVTIEDMKKERLLNKVANTVETICLKEAEKLSQELVDQGYDVDSFELDLGYELEGEAVVVHIDVVQKARTLKFNLKDIINT